jgi:hypothetical protein
VQPVAVVDVLAVLAASLEGPAESRAYDIGGPERLSYDRLMRMYADVAGLLRIGLPSLAPSAVLRRVDAVAGQVAGRVAGRITGVPAGTVSALVESLHHDMVCAEDSFRSRLLPPGHRLLGVRESLERALTRPRAGTRVADRDPMGPLPGDPAWAGGAVYRFDGRVRHHPRGAAERLLLGVRRPW